MTNLDIDRICRENRHQSHPPEVFLVSPENFVTQLLCVSIFFLEEGQQLACAGPPLIGAAFGPDWGFTQAEIVRRADGLMEFRLTRTHVNDFPIGDLHGYRICVIEDHEKTKIKKQLYRIRALLMDQRKKSHKQNPVNASFVASL